MKWVLQLHISINSTMAQSWHGWVIFKNCFINPECDQGKHGLILA